jgi:hypothetical protein
MKQSFGSSTLQTREGFIMKLRLSFLLTTFLLFLLLAFGSLLRAQQADQDPAPATPGRSDTNPTPQAHANDAQIPASGAITTHQAKIFSGNIVKENGELVLKDPVTKVSYKLSDQTKAKPYLGKQVKITGKLEINSNTIRVDGIEPRS